MVDDKEQEQVKPGADEILIKYAAEIGFIETDQVRQLRMELPEIETLDAFTSKATDYQNLGEQQVDRCSDNIRPKAQIGLIVATAAIYYKQGLFSDSTDTLKDAVEYADQMGYKEIVNKIMAILLTDEKYNYRRK